MVFEKFDEQKSGKKSPWLWCIKISGEQWRIGGYGWQGKSIESKAVKVYFKFAEESACGCAFAVSLVFDNFHDSRFIVVRMLTNFI